VLRLTVLVDDVAAGRGLIAEHGYSLWIEHDGRKYLLDTGQGYALGHNSRMLGIHLAEMSGILLSHGHYDHTGGLAEAVNLRPGIPIYVHPKAFEGKYVRSKSGDCRSIGVPEASMSMAVEKADLHWTHAPTTVHGRMHLTGPIPRITTFEDTGGPFCRDAACEEPDPLTDDQAAYIETAKGLVVILGCGHAGVINTLKYVGTLTNDAPIHTVIGGMHLLSAGLDRIDRTIAEMKALGIRRLIPLHCTGVTATARFFQDLPAQSALCSIGTVLEYD
jgi:7,8-dihydropterin-6-yl-methyl-4-(beta-D-ribofuranosyl)aminobenzene 5'-phosphate synthase